jgi:hypothetical protein
MGPLALVPLLHMSTPEPAPTQPESAPPAAPRSRQKFFAFSAVGVAMVCVPLVQLLHYQSGDLQQLQAERALLDPVTQAVSTQYSLLTHRDLAAQVLTGRKQFEPDRRYAQGDVDANLQTLSTVLTTGSWTFALAEAHSLQTDWQQLAEQVTAQRLTAPQSHDAHALRLEQTLQVIDMVTVSSAPGPTPGPGSSLPASRTAFAATARLLPRMAREEPIATTTAATAGAPNPAVTGAAGSSPPAALKALHAAIIGPAPAALAPALAEVKRSSQAHLATRAQADSTAAAQVAAAQAARQAQWRLFKAVRAQHETALLDRIRQVRQQRLWSALGLLALAGLATALALRVLGAMRTQPAVAPPEPPASARAEDELASDTSANQPVKHRVETGLLIDRLRSGDIGQSGPTAEPPAPKQRRKGQYEDTLPP